MRRCNLVRPRDEPSGLFKRSAVDLRRILEQTSGVAGTEKAVDKSVTLAMATEAVTTQLMSSRCY